MDSLAEPRWPPALAVMKKVDDLLRCGICFEYFNIAMMIPQCSHNYCSLCIRKFLSYKTQCPTCCVTVTEPDLKNNRVLDELVKNLNFARNHLLQFALESPPISAASSSSKNLATKADTAVAFRHSLKQGSKLMENFLIRESGGSASELLIKENESKLSPQKKLSSPAKTRGTPSAVKSAPGSSEDSVLETPSTSALKQVTKVDCPVCGVKIPENHINKHLDSCLSREEKKESLRSSVHKRKPLPKTVYNLLSDRDLKKKLKQHGLSVQGNKQQLIKRHQEFVHMYNAQCDALHPKSAAEIVQEIENMEKTRMRFEASKLNESVMVFTKNQTEKEIDEIHSKYRQEDNKIKSSDTPSVETNHFRQSKLDFPGKLERSRQDDSFSCTDIQEEALSSSESDSFKSSSSDIIRDLLEEEEAWEASHKNDFQDREISPGQNRRTRSAESAELEPRNKRNRN
ncbi:E3 ubiquitin-protein ligase RAD18 isoform X4 [Bos indicus]|uniref:E3 ubiquitin-protein ligase RAD18 n=3 Tax=Bos TaxID=9903 RepID=Q32LH8_BOVIN|nr:E3 ubiquitin-protein ligase RAD18 [Bos taurus]XP_027378712.1 E3 ubiquitin-protein ligase RAD18 isoform X5 [Bos indicus x Bos taurus]AAI09569.1 RAD18 protein [Bos taurus]DAA17150.1 TPA: postreplication repair protein hRAD18p [Bos taurus]